MAAPATPTSFNLQTGNLSNFLSFSLVAGATSYSVQRSTDGVTYSVLDTPTVPSYLDEAVTEGTQYWYKVASVNGDGTSNYTAAQSIIPAPTAEMSLGHLRLSAQQKADMVNSQFITLPEWNTFLNLAMYELYDLLIAAYGNEYFMAPRARFQTDGSSFAFPLPNGVIEFQDANGDDIAAVPFYKLLGVDLGLNSSQNAWVTVNKFNLIDRNKYLYPNSQSTQYGVFNMQYRLMGTKIEFIPTPSANQTIQLLYIPRLRQLLQDTDVTTIGFSGWLNYVIVRAAKYALDKEESDSSKCDAELLFLKERIEAMAENRDAGQPDTISDIRNNFGWGGQGSSGPIGGF